MSFEQMPLRRRGVGGPEHVNENNSRYNSTDEINLVDDDETDSRLVDERERTKRESRKERLKVWFWDFIAVIMITTSLLALASTENVIVCFVTALNCFFGVFLSWQSRFLSQRNSIRRVQGQLRRQTGILSEENGRLWLSLEQMNLTLDRLEIVESELLEIGKDESNVLHMVQLVDEKRRINQEIKKRLREEVVQNILTVVIRSDKNENFQLSPQEMENMILRLRMIRGVHFHEDRFRQKLALDSDHSLRVIMGLIRSVVNKSDEDGNNDAIITLRSSDLR